MKVLFIGDIFGEAGRKFLKWSLPSLEKKYDPDIVIANGENSAGGFGITPDTYLEIVQSGVDVITGGNHSFDKKEGMPLHDSESNLLRPGNYPSELPGKGLGIFSTKKGKKIAVMNLMGRTFMDPLDCPFRLADKMLEEIGDQTNCVLLDFHAETTSEKMAMGWHLDGRVSCVVGTHTHTPTSDERILDGGTAFLTDAGMTGPYDSVIGVKKEIIVERFKMRKGRRFEAASKNPWLCGLFLEINDESGKCENLERIQIRSS